MNDVKSVFQKFYDNFVCSASLCPDTCCKDWDIVVDDDTSEFYSTVSGSFGKKLSDSLTIDGDGDRVIRFENGICPFLNDKSLCEVQIKLGEEHLCDTCRVFPRLTQDYTQFSEQMLSLACPEAAKMILGYCGGYESLPKPEEVEENSDYSAEFMNFLLRARNLTFDIFNESDRTFKEQLKHCLAFTEYVQTLIDDDNFDCNELSEFEYTESNKGYCDDSFIFEMHRKLDIMDEQWMSKLCSSPNCKLADNIQIDNEFRNMAYYYILRYYLNAIDSYDIITNIKRLVCAYVAISSMIALSDAENDFDTRVLIAQKYSKEVEHSYENSEFFADEFYKNPLFSAENLLSVL